MTDNPVTSRNTAAYYAQAVASFALALGAVTVGIFKLNTDPWVRAFLGITVLYLTTSAFTPAKVIRDRQEEGQIVNRVDQARLEKMLADYDPLQKL
jgi:hypothetical protein